MGVRLGHATDRMPLKFQWFQKSQPLGAVLEIPLSHGDMYVMSDKAVGHDWMKDRKGLTLRHAALNGFFGLTPSNGAGTARYNAYRARLVDFSPSMLPQLDSATPGTPSASL